MLSDLEVQKLHEARLREFELAREHSILVRFALKAKEQLKLFEPLRKIRR